MKKFLLVMLVLAECLTANAGGRFGGSRHQRRICQPQPSCCQPMATSYFAMNSMLPAERIVPLTTTCICALYPMSQMNGYTYYYAMTCPSGPPTGLSGSFSAFGCMAGCPSTACISIASFRSLSGSPDQANKPGTKLDKLHKHNDVLDLKSSAGKYQTTDLLNGNHVLVRFDVGFSHYYAKLHILKLEEMDGGKFQLRGQFPIGQQIEEPAASGMAAYNYTQLPSASVTRIDEHVALVTVGNITYQVVTLDSIPVVP